MAHVSSMDLYRQLYRQSVNDPDTFWTPFIQDFVWDAKPKPPYRRENFDIRKGPIFVSWFEGGKTNLCVNCLDRHVEAGFGDTVVFHWVGNEPSHSTSFTYAQLLNQVCKFANVLKSQGLKKGDVVALYMPMILELPVAVLACARLGIVHSVVFGGYSPDALAERILDAQCTLLVTADGVFRGTKQIHLMEIAEKALKICDTKGHAVRRCVVVPHLSERLHRLKTNDGLSKNMAELHLRDSQKEYDKWWNKDRDVLWDDLMKTAPNKCDPVWMDAEDPLFVLYTSGSTGKPKGIVHTTAGYMVYAATTFKYVFDYHPEDVYFCTADIGWITGHSYGVYGPLLNRATNILFEGIPMHPDAGRLWQIIDDYRVTKFYTAPTAIRTLMKYGDDIVKRYKLDSLKVLGSVGEPINPEAWRWYHRVVGQGRCPIVDTYWQTETGGHVLTPLPGCTPLKPGSATFAFFGVVPALLDDHQRELEGPAEGSLVMKQSWPGMMRTLLNNHQRYESVYFTPIPGYYFTGDGARRDENGYLWITGRVDDMFNVSGHLISTAEVESAILLHPSVAESAVVSCPHPVKGECIYCFVILKQGFEPSEKLRDEIKLKVREKIGPVATPDYFHFTPGLPKTRSGKIMRRVLRKVTRKDHDVGDLSTLADPQIVEELFNTHPL